MQEIDLVFPDNSEEWEWTSKGYCPKVLLRVNDKKYLTNFYEAVRLSQDAADEVAGGEVFFEENLVVLETVTRESMTKAARWLIEAGQLGAG